MTLVAAWGCSHASPPRRDAPAFASFAWPEGARAAVSLTYDDAIPSQRTLAAEQLRAHKLHGTFFLTGTSMDLAEHRGDWVSLGSAGHELASHTMHHPCDRSFDWVRPGFAIQDYDLDRMRRELEDSRALLGELGAPQPYSFAYPCGGLTVGENAQSYVPLVAELFVAGRGVGDRVADPNTDPLEQIPAIDGAQPGSALVELVDAAVRQGGWLVLVFHGVGGDYLSVTAQAHETLLKNLADRDDVWTAPFGTVGRHVAASRMDSAESAVSVVAR